MLDITLHDGTAYSHGISYRTTSASLPANSKGTQSILADIRAATMKSLFVCFYDVNTTYTAGSVNGKYDS